MNVHKIIGGSIVVVTVIAFVSDLVAFNSDGWHIWHTTITILATGAFVIGVTLFTKENSHE